MRGWGREVMRIREIENEIELINFCFFVCFTFFISTIY